MSSRFLQEPGRSQSVQRRGHTPQISISDDNYHVTEAVGDMYGDNEWPTKNEARPLSFAPSVQERALERKASKFSSSSNPSNDTALSRTLSSERYPRSPNGSAMDHRTRKSSLGSTPERASPSSPSPPDLTRSPSSDTANQHFPLNDIDYESSPAAVAQELSNLQAIRRMSMNVDAADPDLPSFNSGIGMPSVAPSHSDDENDASRLFWVPARLHPELAPKDYKTFVEDRVDRIKRRSGDDDKLPPTGLDRSGSRSSLRRNESLGRRKSMLSKAVETPGDLKDGAEVLERKRSSVSGPHTRKASAETSLQELESLVNDPTSLMRNMSLDTRRRSSESNDGQENEDMPILPTPAGQTLKRSTRTTYRRGSLRKGERMPVSRRAAGRSTDAEGEEDHQDSGTPSVPPLPHTLSRIQTEPPPPPPAKSAEDRKKRGGKVQESRSLQPSTSAEDIRTDDTSRQSLEERRPQPRAFHSRIARNGRTTAPLPGYHPHHSVPQITETPPPEARLSLPPINHTFPERKSSHEFLRANSLPSASARAATRSAFGKQKNQNQNQSLDEMASHPAPMPGTNTSTDALSFIPTFADDKKEKVDKKQKDRKDKDFGESGSRKTSWGWFLGGEEKDKDREKEREKEEKMRDKEIKKEKEREEKDLGKKGKSKLSGKPNDRSHDSTRLDVLQTVSDGPKGRESIVLDRDNLRLEEERKKERTRHKQDGGEKKEKESGIFSSLFGGGKKHKQDRDGNSSNKKHRVDVGRGLSPEPRRKILRADIDYNWTRFSILEERAIYRMAHIKLANPRRALYSQVLLSNFMYSYLAKVQQMHPQIQIPAFVNQKSNQKRQSEEQSRQSDEYQQWQAYQEQQERLHGNETHEEQSENSGSTSSVAPFIDDYDPEHQQSEDSRKAQHANGSASSSRKNQTLPEQDPYIQQGLFDEERPPDDSDMW